RGDLRPARVRALPPRGVVRALATRPGSGELSLRPARCRRPGVLLRFRHRHLSATPRNTDRAAVARRRQAVVCGAGSAAAVIGGVVGGAVVATVVMAAGRLGCCTRPSAVATSMAVLTANGSLAAAPLTVIVHAPAT